MCSYRQHVHLNLWRGSDVSFSESVSMRNTQSVSGLGRHGLPSHCFLLDTYPPTNLLRLSGAIFCSFSAVEGHHQGMHQNCCLHHCPQRNAMDEWNSGWMEHTHHPDVNQSKHKPIFECVKESAWPLSANYMLPALKKEDNICAANSQSCSAAMGRHL